MPRRPALVLALTLAVVVTTGGFAAAANYGLLTRSRNEPVGRLNAANVADLAPLPAPAPPSAPATDPAATADPAAAAPVEAPAPVDAAVRAEDDQGEAGDDHHVTEGRTSVEDGRPKTASRDDHEAEEHADADSRPAAPGLPPTTRAPAPTTTRPTTTQVTPPTTERPETTTTIERTTTTEDHKDDGKDD